MSSRRAPSRVHVDDNEALSLDAGQLVHQVTLLKQVPAEDASGPTTTMEDFLTCYAKIEVGNVTDEIRNGQVTNVASVRISIWYQPDIQANMQVRNQGRTFVIRSIDNVFNRNIVLCMDCVAIRGGDAIGMAGAIWDRSVYDVDAFQPDVITDVPIVP